MPFLCKLLIYNARVNGLAGQVRFLYLYQYNNISSIRN